MKRINKWFAFVCIAGLLSSLIIMKPAVTRGAANDPSKYEAEDGTLFGSTPPKIFDDAGASGGKVVGNLNYTGDGIEFANVVKGNKLSIYYAAQWGGSISVYINDTKAATIAIPGNGRWFAPYDVLEQTVDIPEGATLKLQRDEGDSAVDIDYIQISDIAPTSNTVLFDSGGRFTDPLDNLDHIFSSSGVTQAGSSLTGPGEVIYSAGASEFQSISIDTTFNKWSLNFEAADDLTVSEVAYDADTGIFTDSKQVPIVRKLRPDFMTSKDIDKATYVSGKLSPGTKYLRISLPREGYFSDAGKHGDFQVDGITFTSNAAASAPLDYTADVLSDFSHFVQGTDTSNLTAANLTDIWEIRTFAAKSFIERSDATLPDKSMTYAAPNGKEFRNAYVEGYYNFAPSSAFEVWASQNGTSYTNVTLSSHYITPAVAYESNWLPTVLEIQGLPAGTKYVQIRLPAYTAAELYGMKHPRMTKVALDYGDLTETANTTVKFTSSTLNIDGIVDPAAGEWQGALSANIQGVVDGNGDTHNAKVYLKYDYDNLFVGAKIKDPTPMINSNTGSNIWGGDNLELFLGTEDLNYILYPDKKNTMIPSDVQVVLSGGIDNGFQFYLYKDGVFTFPDITMNVKKDADGKGYTIEAAIPLGALGITEPWVGKQMILNPILNDGDFAGRGQWGWTTNGEATKKNRGLWGLAAFEPTSAPPTEIMVNASVNGSMVTVSGQTVNVQSQDVTIAVSGPGGNIVYIDQAPSDAQGNYSFTFAINGDVAGSGLYTATVGGAGVNRTNKAVFSFTPDTTAPAEAANVGIKAANKKLKVSWTDPADSDYDHALVSVQGKSGTTFIVPKGKQSAVIGKLTNGTEYTVLVRTVDRAGNVSQGVTVSGKPGKLKSAHDADSGFNDDSNSDFNIIE